MRTMHTGLSDAAFDAVICESDEKRVLAGSLLYAGHAAFGAPLVPLVVAVVAPAVPAGVPLSAPLHAASIAAATATHSDRYLFMMTPNACASA
jgi:hypothetical protein